MVWGLVLMLDSTPTSSLLKSRVTIFLNVLAYLNCVDGLECEQSESR